MAYENQKSFHLTSFLPAHMLRAGIVFGSVCVSVCLSAQNLQNYWTEIDVTWLEYAPWYTLEVVWRWWHLTLSFDLKSYFHTFWIHAIYFKWLDLATLFSVYIFITSRPQFSFKDMGPRSRSWQQNSSSMQLKNYWPKIEGAWSEYLLW